MNTLRDRFFDRDHFNSLNTAESKISYLKERRRWIKDIKIMLEEDEQIYEICPDITTCSVCTYPEEAEVVTKSDFFKELSKAGREIEIELEYLSDGHDQSLRLEISKLYEELEQLKNRQVGTGYSPQDTLCAEPENNTGRTARKIRWTGETQEQLVTLFEMLHGTGFINSDSWKYLPSLLENCFSYNGNKIDRKYIEKIKRELNDSKKDEIMKDIVERLIRYSDPIE